MKNRLVLAAAMMLAPMAAHAAPITYSGQKDLSSAVSVSYTFMTDGALGALKPSDFTNFSLMVNENGYTTTLTPTDSELIFVNQPNYGGMDVASADGYKLTATPEALRFLFGDTSYSVIVESGGAHLDYFCINCGDMFTARTRSVTGYSDAQSGNVAFAFATSAAPEPSTWALMFAGVGTMGVVLRRRAVKTEPHAPTR